MARALFILKKRKLYGSDVPAGIDGSSSSGLFNSAKFVSDMLDAQYGIESKVVEVVDNNDIDREVSNYLPSHVFIEALWVVPEKFDVLTSLHPHVQWIIRLHSNTPFLSNEGVAFDWIQKYLTKPNVSVSANHALMFEDLVTLFPNSARDSIQLHPNYYPFRKWIGDIEEFPTFWSKRVRKYHRRETDIVKVGCFGAIRPLKNQVTQAVGAIRFAEQENITLHFHINSARVERGENALKNLRALFANSRHKLIEHSWMPHSVFRDLVASMDVIMQVSFSETFNIVTADAVSQGVPVVVSKEIDWIAASFWADPTDTYCIAHKLKKALECPTGPWRNAKGLKRYNRWSREVWLDYFDGERDYRVDL